MHELLNTVINEADRFNSTQVIKPSNIVTVHNEDEIERRGVDASTQVEGNVVTIDLQEYALFQKFKLE
jgi:hypothetical protein